MWNTPAKEHSSLDLHRELQEGDALETRNSLGWFVRFMFLAYLARKVDVVQLLVACALVVRIPFENRFLLIRHALKEDGPKIKSAGAQ